MHVVEFEGASRRAAVGQPAPRSGSRCYLWRRALLDLGVEAIAARPDHLRAACCAALPVAVDQAEAPVAKHKVADGQDAVHVSPVRAGRAAVGPMGAAHTDVTCSKAGVPSGVGDAGGEAAVATTAGGAAGP